MKNVICIMLLLSACTSKTLKKAEVTIKSTTHNGITDHVQANGKYHMSNRYCVGDVDGDHKPDTAFVDYDLPMGSDSTPDYYGGSLSKTIKFNKGIPSIIIDQSVGLLVRPSDIPNRNGGNAIQVFNRYWTGSWKELSAYVLYKNKWLEIAHTKMAGEDNADFENRTIQLRESYYLLGDKWDGTIGFVPRSDTIKIIIPSL